MNRRKVGPWRWGDGKASLQDYTDPYNPITIDGNEALQVSMPV